MPELRRFLGVVVYMHFNDHNPPHFHVRYGDFRAAIAISSLGLLEGGLPARILGYVIEWAMLHKKELMNDWDMLQSVGKYFMIPPLV